MPKYPSSSLIIATYNWPEALKLVLMSIKEQALLPNEVIIADDGSKKETQELIASFEKKFPVPLHHVWHEDKGFRKTIILNNAIKSSKHEYIIFLDGDLILHKKFILNHLSFAKKGSFIEGSRVWLNQNLTLFSQKKERLNFYWFSKGIKNRLNAMYIPFLKFLLKNKSKDTSYVINTRGCNLAIWKDDLIKVNGFNQEMTGWGREDSELCVRLRNLGIFKEKIKFSAIQYHQYHQINERNRLSINDRILEKTIQQKITYCKKGIKDLK